MTRTDSCDPALLSDLMDDEFVRSPVLQRAANILNAFDPAHPVLRLQDISDRAKLPKSTAHRFAAQLVELGWLEPVAGGYRIGMRLFEIAGLIERRNRLRDAAVPYMHRLAEKLGGVIHLGILDASDVVCIEKVPFPGLTLPTRQGGRMPVHSTAMGKAMLAYLGNDEVERSIERGLPRHTRNTISDPTAFRAELSTISDRGVAYDNEESHRSYSCVAVPIRDSGRAISALSISARTETLDLDEAAHQIGRAAREIWPKIFVHH